MSDFSEVLEALVSAATPPALLTRTQSVDQILSVIKSGLTASAGQGLRSYVYPHLLPDGDPPRVAILAFLADNNLTYTISDPVDGRSNLCVNW
jgi:hypothetical protein